MVVLFFLKVPSSWPLYSRPGPRGRLQLGFERYTSSSRAQQVDADWAFADCFDTHAYLGLRVHRSWALLEQSSGESNDCPFRGSPIIVDRRVMPTSPRHPLLHQQKYQVLFQYTIFFLLHMLCVVLGASFF